MEPADRVRAALAQDVADRPPAAWWGHTFLEEWSASELAAVTVSRARRFGWDFVKLQPRACCFAEAFGSEYRPSGDALKPPVLVRAAVPTRDRWADLPAVDADAAPLRDQIEALRLAATELDLPVIQTVFSPLTVAGYLAGEDRERAVRELLDDPGTVSAALGRIASALVDFAARSIEAGAAGIFYAITGFASEDLMSSEDYERVVLPHDRGVVEALAGAWFNVLHLCGPRQNLGLARQFGLQAVSWSIHDAGNPSLAEARDRLGVAAMGGIDRHGALARGSPETVAAQREDAIRATGGRGLLVAPGCSVPPKAPEDNLLEVTRTVADLGEGA